MKGSKPRYFITTIDSAPSLRRMLQLAAFSCAGLSASALAADITLLANDAIGSSSFTGAPNWSNAAAPSAGNKYFSGGFTVRTPLTAESFVFGGDSLQIDSGDNSRLLGKGAGNNTTQTITIPNLILNGGRLEQASGDTTGVVLVVKGNITVTGPSFLGSLGGNANGTPNYETMDIMSTISGPEMLTVGGTGNGGANRGVVRLSAANTYTGEIDIFQPTNGNTISSATNRLLQLNHLDALRFATLGLYTSAENGASFSASANTGTFRVGALNGYANQTLTDTAGNPVTLEIGGSGLTGFYSGSLKGSGNLVKTGNGTAVFEGQPQLFTGSVSVLGGTLSLGTNALINNNSAVSVASGAKLELTHGDTDTVASLTLGGVLKADGIYDSSNSGGYIIGTGKIRVSTGTAVPDNVKMLANDPVGTSSLTGIGQWSNGLAPAAINSYFSQAFQIRTPDVAGDINFPGASLTIEAGGRLLGKGPGSNNTQKLTLASLVLNGGRLEQAGLTTSTDAVLAVNAPVSVTAASYLGAIGGNGSSVNFETLDLTGIVSGSAALRVAGTENGSFNRGVVRLSAANTYTGTISVEEPAVIASDVNRLLQLNHPDAVRYATVALATTSPNPLSFTSTANTGTFRVGGLTGTASQRLVDTTGAAVIVEVGGSNATSIYDGFLEGAGALVKAGTGTLTITGTSTYTGNTTVTGGTLSLSKAGLADASTVSISAGAVLNLTHGQADVVKSLVLNNVVQPAGTYTAANSGGRITGTGSIQVTSAGSTGFAGFMDQYTGLTSGQKALTADPDGDGISNLLEYALDGMNPTVANALPGLVDRKVTFAKRALAVSNGDVTYTIEVSGTLGAAPEPWTAVTPDTNDATTISYTLPAGSVRKFVRLRIDTNP